jgi:hypothetical protein
VTLLALIIEKHTMIKHIVFFKLTGSLTPEKKLVQLKKMEEIFSPLSGKFPFIIEYRTGINFTEAPHAWDFVIDSIFKNKADLHEYMVSDLHMDAVRKASSIEKTKAVIDYEF